MNKDRVKEEMLQEIMNYGVAANEIRDTAEILNSIWNDEAGDRICQRVKNLTEEMNDNYERLRKWIGSGSL